MKNRVEWDTTKNLFCLFYVEQGSARTKPDGNGSRGLRCGKYGFAVGT